ncbi:MAG: helix-turn-helix transcriptional regulator [Bacteroidetes bacterium]|nr:helix-turn-helix transcriptional regulator [Bacteroidota bacterium]
MTNRNTITEQYPKIYLYRRIVQAKLFIDANYADNIDLDNISDEAYFSKFHFIRLFKNIYGKTPHQYLIAVRIDRAMQLLKSDKPVSDTCYAVGFESLSSFSGLFKRIVGITPSIYLMQQQKIKAQIKSSPLTFVPGCFAEKNGWLKNRNFRETKS